METHTENTYDLASAEVVVAANLTCLSAPEMKESRRENKTYGERIAVELRDAETQALLEDENDGNQKQ
ncbi:hypothetical protein DL98DRAFT_600245 [Cadophora sp. DSE1049]|nr:hypothetical protein DL98DRAFT_600245 [Cadophora sp. DSE1049]